MSGATAVRRLPTAATATANANIALIKYWGKADEELIIPTTSSLSLTLGGLGTTTTVEFADAADNGHTSADQPQGDTLSIDGAAKQGAALHRVSAFLDLVRSLSGLHASAHVTSHNTVPYAAGLASSSSAFAALAAAASSAAGLALSPRDLSRLARRGSGSACRSIFAGLVRWNAGHDDQSSYAEPISSDLDLAVVVVLISADHKRLSSREAMQHTMATSPLYASWVRASAGDLQQALEAVDHHDIEHLGEVAEANALGMHAAMMASRPAVMYWLPGTLAAYRAVQEIRSRGFAAWATMDAGPNVKVLTTSDQAPSVAAALADRLGGLKTHVYQAGAGVQVQSGSGPGSYSAIG